MKILIVDDIEENLYMLETLLKGHGYDVVSAKNGVDALGKLKKNSIDIIISDGLMPKMDGFQLCRECKSDDALKNIPFLFYTATYSDKKDEEFALGLGADKFLIKPVEPEVLLKILKSVIETNKKGVVVTPKKDIENEEIFLKHYNERLIKKLEKKMLELEKDIAERKRAEEKLRESEERFRNIAEESFDIIFIIDPAGNLIYVSPAVERFTGYRPGDLIGKPLRDHIPASEIPKTQQALKELNKGKNIEGLEFEILNKDGSTVFLEINANPIYKGGEIIDFQGIARDITERKRAEEGMKKRLMKFKVEEGSLYLVQETTPRLSREAFRDLLKIGYRGLVISRTPVKDIENYFEGDIEFVWLSEKKGKNTLPPVLKKIELKVESMPKHKIILIERLDYLISKHGFKKILSFVQHLWELAVISNYVIILSIDPSILNDQELKIIAKEAKEVEPLDKPKLHGNLLDILKFIYEQNITGTKPSYTEICQELELSKPTVRKRIRFLISAKYIKENFKGRTKVVEMSERGKNIFLE